MALAGIINTARLSFVAAATTDHSNGVLMREGFPTREEIAILLYESDDGPTIRGEDLPERYHIMADALLARLRPAFEHWKNGCDKLAKLLTEANSLMTSLMQERDALRVDLARVTEERDEYRARLEAMDQSLANLEITDSELSQPTRARLLATMAQAQQDRLAVSLARKDEALRACVGALTRAVAIADAVAEDAMRSLGEDLKELGVTGEHDQTKVNCSCDYFCGAANAAWSIAYKISQLQDPRPASPYAQRPRPHGGGT